MGIELKNPIIVGACNLVTDPKNLKRLEEAGASAVVYKSLFEEQLHLENLMISEVMDAFNDRHPEMVNLFPEFDHAGPKEYITNLKNAKKALKIPLFASLNAVYEESWIDYAKEIEKAGIDGIELNLYNMPSDNDAGANFMIENQIKIVEGIKASVKIPVAVKLSPFYANPIALINKMDHQNADAFVLFNRLFQPDIDIEKEQLHFPYNLSSEGDYRLAMRFAGLLHGNIKADICSSGGIFNGNDVAKMLLAGANTVQVVSTLYINGLGHISVMLDQLKKWMDSKSYTSVNDFRGKLSKKNISDPFAYNRAQYMDERTQMMAWWGDYLEKIAAFSS